MFPTIISLSACVGSIIFFCSNGDACKVWTCWSIKNFLNKSSEVGVYPSQWDQPFHPCCIVSGVKKSFTTVILCISTTTLGHVPLPFTVGTSPRLCCIIPNCLLVAVIPSRASYKGLYGSPLGWLWLWHLANICYPSTLFCCSAWIHDRTERYMGVNSIPLK